MPGATGKKTPPRSVTRLATLLDQGPMRGRGRTSPLARWLRAHHDEFHAMLIAKQPSWEEVAAALAAMGVHDGDDKPPAAERVRKAWWTIRRATATARATRANKPQPPPLAPGEIAPAVLAIPPPDSIDTPRPRPRLDIRPALPRTETPGTKSLGIGTPATPAPVPLPVAPSPDSATSPPLPADTAVGAELNRLRQQMEAAKVPLPKIVR